MLYFFIWAHDICALWQSFSHAGVVVNRVREELLSELIEDIHPAKEYYVTINHL
jgi:hypothetical protein